MEAPGTTVAARLQEVLHPIHRQPIPQTWQFHLQHKVPATETGHLALANAASRLTTTGPQGLSASLFQSPQRLQGLALSWNPEPLPMLSIGAGYIHEPESLLGSRANGAFGQLSADIAFLSAGLNTTAGRWILAAVGEMGAVKPSVASSGWIDHVSSLATSAFRLQASRAFDTAIPCAFPSPSPYGWITVRRRFASPRVVRKTVWSQARPSPPPWRPVDNSWTSPQPLKCPWQVVTFPWG